MCLVGLASRASAVLLLCIPASFFELLRRCALWLASSGGARKKEDMLDSRHPQMSALQAPTALGDIDRIDTMCVFNISVPKGFQRRSKLEKSMRDWFDNGEATASKFVLCGPGGIGKSTLVCIYIYIYVCLVSGAQRHDKI